MISRTFPVAVVAVLSIACAAPALAQSQNAAADLSSLHDALHLTAAQEDSWRAYRAAILPDPTSELRHRSAAMMMTTLTTPRRVDLINAEMEEDFAMMRRQGEAVKAFYATLTPDQQRTFDHQTLQTGGSGGQTLRQPAQGQQLPPPR